MSVSPAVLGEPKLVPSLFKLLRLRLTILFNSIRRAKKRAKIAYAIIAFGIFVFWGVSLLVSTTILDFLLSPQLADFSRNGKRILETIPSAVISISGWGILFTSFSVLLQALYLSNDMDFLMSAPIPVRAVFVAKLVQAVLPNFIFLCLLTLPILFGLGISGGYHFLYFPFVIFMLSTIALSAASLASLLVLIAARFFPPRRVAEILGFFIGLAFFVGSQMAPRLMGHTFDNSNHQQVGVFLDMLAHLNHPFSPLAWAGRGLVGIGKSEWINAFFWISASLLTTAFIFYTALIVCERLYYNGWASLQNNSVKIKKKPISIAVRKITSSRKVSPLARTLPAPVRAVLIKDLRLYCRDLRSITGLLLPMILGVIYAFGLVQTHWQMPQGRGQAPPGFIQAGNALYLYSDIGLTLFLGWMLVGNLAGLAFSREAKNYWMLKSAPVNTRQLLASKFLVSFLPSVLVCSIYLIILELLKGVAIVSIAIGMASVWLMIAGLTGIYLALGTRGAKFDWENPAQIYQTVGCLGMLVSLLFVPICFGLFISPAILAQIFHIPEILGRLAGLLLGGLFCALAVVLPLSLVEKRVSTLSEPKDE